MSVFLQNKRMEKAARVKPPPVIPPAAPPHTNGRPKQKTAPSTARPQATDALASVMPPPQDRPPAVKNPRVNTNRTGPVHVNQGTNDGTHRISIKWNTLENIATYENNPQKVNTAMQTILQSLFTDEDGKLYR